MPVFHWEVEFPEVFGRENAGFDAVVGNPPFLGGTRISSAFGEEYLAWLVGAFPASGNRMDLVGYIFRRSFQILRGSGTAGLVATNTIAQGDTRAGGLGWISLNGGAIYDASKRLPWPGMAAVVVSVVHLRRGKLPPPARLNGRDVQLINAYLFHAGGSSEPEKLMANAGRTFEGYKVAGQGFLFDDNDPGASPVGILKDLLDSEPRNAEVVGPYIGGEEVCNSPGHTPHRYAINFGSMTVEEAGEWPNLLSIIAAKVKPARDVAKRDSHRRRWWQYGEVRPGLRRALAQGVGPVLVVPRVGQHLSFAMLARQTIFSEQLVVIPSARWDALAVLQSRVHEIWARFFGSSLEDRLRYTPTDCFETFPFPENWESNPTLEDIGDRYHTFRADLMVANNQGLTATYNRFHDPDERDPQILQLRGLHAEMDRAVLDAYGFVDVPTDCEFLLDYEEDEAEGDGAEAGGSPGASPTRARRKKKPYRYRWPEAVHDDVLARLLELNRVRAEAERLAGLGGKK